MTELIDSMQAFQSYAMAFEQGFASGDWKVVDDRLTGDAVWTVHGAPPPYGGISEGRDAVIRAIRASVDAFDRRFDTREPRVVDGPTRIPGGVHFTWIVTYRREGVPPFELHGEEWDFFRDGKLEFHREKLSNATEAQAFLGEHDAQLRCYAAR